MKTETVFLIKAVRVSLFGLLLFPICLQAQAETIVVVDKDDKVVVAQPVGYVQAVATPVVITREVITGDFEGRVVEIDYTRNEIIVNDTNGRDRAVSIQSEAINNYRIGDYVLIHPTTAVTLVTVEAENPKVFEGEIIRVDIPNSQIVVLDTNGRERKVLLKQGMIGTYKVDDYVQIHLLSDLKEAKTIKTISDVRNLDGRIVSVNASRSQIVIHSAEGKDNAVYVRQGQVSNYRVGDNVRVYLLRDREQVQVIRVIR